MYRAVAFGYPVRFARASLKPLATLRVWRLGVKLSRAFCAGLIEARPQEQMTIGFPCALSRAFCAGLIEAYAALQSSSPIATLSRAFCAGLIEARRRGR